MRSHQQQQRLAQQTVAPGRGAGAGATMAKNAPAAVSSGRGGGGWHASASASSPPSAAFSPPVANNLGENKKNRASTLPKSTDTLTRKRREKWETEDRSKSKLEEAQEDSCCGLLPILLCRRKMELLDLLSIVMLLSSLALIVASSAAIFLGVVLLASYLTHHLGFVSLYYVSVPYCIVIVGIVTIFGCVYGCCVSVSRNRCNFWVLAVVLAVLCALQLTAVFVANELRIIIDSGNFLQADVISFAKEYPKSAASKSSWDALQTSYVCCGGTSTIAGYELWVDLMNDLSAPDSCCLKQTVDCGKEIFKKVSKGNLGLHIITRGCMVVIEDDLMAEVSPMLQAYVTGGVVMGFVEVCCSFLACYAACYIRSLMLYYEGEYEDEEEEETATKATNGRVNNQEGKRQEQQQQQRPQSHA